MRNIVVTLSENVEKEDNMWSKLVSDGPTASLFTISVFTEQNMCLESADSFVSL